MAHKQQIEFCNSIKALHPEFFENKNVLDVGSMDINGNNRYLFTGCTYIGVDVTEGANVDVVTPIHLYETPFLFDTVISTEMLEHDMMWQDSLIRMVELTATGGMLLITCASTGRPEHGTIRSGSTWASPGSSNLFGDYYRNLTEDDLRSVIDCDKTFSVYAFQYNAESCDLYFYGIKK